MTNPNPTAPGPVEVIEGPESYILLTVDTSGPPALMLHANGDIYVKGRLAASDQEVVDALREFLAATKPTVASVTAAMARLTTEERDLILHTIKRQYPTHCLGRSCLRGSSAGDRFTALEDIQTVDPTGCECDCYACRTAADRYSSAEP